MKILSFISCIFLTISGFSRCSGSEWSYGDYSKWTGICQSGMAQSPIDLVESESREFIHSAFIFRNYDHHYAGTVMNNGHSIAINLSPSNGTVPTVSGGGLTSTYILHHIHFHWQSEHTLNGQSFPLEMHLVHYSEKYHNLKHAMDNGGIAVLGVFFELIMDDDHGIVPLMEVIDKVVRSPKVQIGLERAISPRSFLPRNTADYFRYQGSLTTPQCNEGVIWTVFLNPLPISYDQIARIEDTWSEDGPLTLNFRPVQPLNGRVVQLRQSPSRYRYHPDSDNGDIRKTPISLILTVLISFIALMY